MKKFFIPSLLILFLTPFAFAQQLEWAITYGGSAPSYGTSISLDSSNNVMVAGYFESTADFNPGAGVNSITSQGMNDGYLQRVNAQTGFYTGTTTVGGTLQDRTIDAVPDHNGNLYSVGHFMGTVDLDPLAGVYSVTSAGGYDGFLVKTNDISQLLWAKTFSSPGLCNMSNVLVDQNNDLYVSGFFYDSVDLDPGAGVDMHYSSGYEDFFILKLDPNGNFIWGRSFGGTLSDQSLSMTLDQNNQLIVGGYFQGTVNFNPLGTPINLTSGGGADFFIMKMDANGNTLWAKSGGASGSESIADVCVDDNDNVYCVGTYASPLVDFDPGPGTFNMPNGGSNDIFVLKLDPAGNFLDARNLSSANNETVKSIAFRNNSIYLAGSYSGTLDFDPLGNNQFRTSVGQNDAYLLKLSSSLFYEWVYAIGSSTNDFMFSVVLDDVGGIYMTGSHEGAMDCDPVPGPPWFVIDNNGGSNSFIIKLFECSNSTSSISVSTCAPYISPSGQSYTTSGVYQSIIPNASGCDSIISISLNILPTSSSSSTVNTCPPFISPSGQIHNNSGVYMDTLVSVNGCDSIITTTFNSLTTSGSISITECTSFTSPSGNFTWTTSGNYQDVLVNNAGCDSILNVSLTILNNSTASVFEQACESYTWPLTGTTYTIGGVYSTNLVNANGCDSTVTLYLNILGPSQGTESITTCGDYTWAANGVTYTTSGTYSALLTSVNGCDSTATLVLTIGSLDVGVSQNNEMLSADLSGASYQWMYCPSMTLISGATSQMYSATLNGSYAVQITSNNCVDTSDCIIVNTIGLSESEMTENIKIYPNPSDGNFTLVLSSEEQVLVTIVNAAGQLLYEEGFEGIQNIQLNPELNSGLYYIRVEKAGKIYHVKLIIKN